MSFQCLKCLEAWEYEDYQCPYCDSATVDTDSLVKPTLEYTFDYKNKTYDVIRIDTGVSIWKDDQ